MADLSLLIEDLPMQREVVAGIVILQREVKGMADLFLWIDDLPVQREEVGPIAIFTMGGGGGGGGGQ